MSSSVVERYPSTDIAAQVGVQVGLSPRTTDLVQAVYLTQFFGQGNDCLTNDLARHAPQQVYFWPDVDKPNYNRTWEGALRFFRQGGAQKLAIASLSRARLTASQLESATESQTAAITQGFLAFWRNRVDLRELRSFQLHPAYLRDEAISVPPDSLRNLWGVWGRSWEDIRRLQDVLRIGRLFMQIDADSLDRGRPAGAFADEPHESMTREAILALRPCGVGVFEALFRAVHGALPHLSSAIRTVRTAWNHHHAGQQFAAPSQSVLRQSHAFLKSTVCDIRHILSLRR